MLANGNGAGIGSPTGNGNGAAPAARLFDRWKEALALSPVSPEDCRIALEQLTTHIGTLNPPPEARRV